MATCSPSERMIFAQTFDCSMLHACVSCKRNGIGVVASDEHVALCCNAASYVLLPAVPVVRRTVCMPRSTHEAFLVDMHATEETLMAQSLAVE